LDADERSSNEPLQKIAEGGACALTLPRSRLPDAHIFQYIQANHWMFSPSRKQKHLIELIFFIRH
jgi:hypothetical protein